MPAQAGTAEDSHHLAGRAPCCGLYHQAVELVGKRWTGALLLVLMDGPLRFSEVRELVPDISDRLLSERMKELEAEGIVERHVSDTGPVKTKALAPKPVKKKPKVVSHKKPKATG